MRGIGTISSIKEIKMFLYSHLKEKILQADTYLKENKTTKAIYDEIRKGKYHVAISFLKEKELLCYEAYDSLNPLRSDRPYFAIAIDISGKAFSYTERREDEYSFISLEEKALFAFAVHLDKELSEKGEGNIERFYSKIHTSFSSLLGLDEKEKEERKVIRQGFLDFMFTNSSEKEDDSLFVPTEKLSLKYHVSDDYNPIVSFDVMMGDKKLFSPRSLNSFFGSYSNLETYSFNGKKMTMSPESFDDISRKAMLFLSNAYFASMSKYGYDGYRSNEIGMSISSFARFLSLIAGESVTFQGKEYYVSNDVQKATVSLSEDGSVSLFPTPKAIERMLFYAEGTNFIVFNDNVGVLERFVFQNAKIGKVYAYFLSNPDASPKMLGDLLVPYVADAEMKEDSNSFKIQLYIDVNDKGELSFRTDYLVFGEAKGENELKDNAYYATKLSRYNKEMMSLNAPTNGTMKDEGDILRFLKEDLSPLKKVAKVFLGERLGKTKVSRVGNIDIHLERNVDWLSLKVRSKEFSELELNRILEAYKAKKKFILLRDKAIILDDPKLAELSELAKSLKLDNRLINDDIPLYEAFNIKSQEGSLNVDYGSFVKNFIDDILSFADKPISLDETLEKTLRPYQIYAVKWLYTLYKNKMGGILADDMGLGKTLETIAFLTLSKKDKPSLIIAPKSVLYSWKEEANRFASSLRVEVIDGSKEERMESLGKMKKGEADVFVISYDSLRNDSEHYEHIEFESIICDEAQTIKNAAALKSKAIKRLKGSFHLALTGTPIENSMSDLWAIFDFLMPGYLRTLPIFKTTYVMAGNQEEARRLLSKRIQPFLLRRTKNEVLKELPPKTVERVSIPMDTESETFYKAVLQEAKKKKKQIQNERDANSKKFSMLPILTKLREICVDPFAFFEGFQSVNAKLSHAIGLVHNAISNGHKVLVFSSFVKVLEHFKSLLLEVGIDSLTISGDVSGKKRTEIVSKFNSDDKSAVMLISLKAGGTGLNLQAADIVIHLDPWWNLASEEQATDRAYRIGQKNPVTVYKLYCRKSIEEKVLELQDSKKELYDSLVHSSSSFLSALTEEDLDFLLM